MTTQVRGLCSMATKKLLGELIGTLPHGCSLEVRFEAAGGVEVARLIRAGVSADLAVLDQKQMSDLEVDGLLLAGTLRPLFISEVVAAGPEGGEALSLSTQAELRAALVGARRIAYSTGPSGKAFLDLVERWELAEVLRHKLVCAVPGRPVGSLVADGEADLGFQQRSELSQLTGVRVIGPLPGASAIHTTFSGAVLARATHAESASEVLGQLGSKDAEEHVIAAGMTIA